MADTPRQDADAVRALEVAERHIVRADRLESALREAIELVEDYAQYVSPFLLEKWGHADDLARIKAALTDGRVEPQVGGDSVGG